MKRLLTQVKIRMGINPMYSKKIRHTVLRNKKQDRLCSLIFDEMSLRAHVTYNASKDSLEGFDKRTFSLRACKPQETNQAIDNFEAQTLEALHETENHLSFFKGILPSLDGFTELQTLTFQSKVINIITEMRFGEQTQSTPLSHADIKLGNSMDITLHKMPSHHHHRGIEQMNSTLPDAPVSATLQLIILQIDR
ncbi:unnamed protein product [Pieris macdunnoughi]|uniref:Transposable element P transposase-like RNase H domain-containing protein n=1 Tax=Pieris macdunnoughi TaxID=345717 RepID=A0A821VKE0_9NEOP|nr:unnamed protein product [Pieris macdunnoughi]